MWRASVRFVCYAILASGASAQAAEARQPLTANDVTPQFTHRPNLPPGLLAAHAQIKVAALRTVSGQGALVDCNIIKENPASSGLADVLREWASSARVPLTDKEGKPTTGRQFRLGLVVNAGLPADVVTHPVYSQTPTASDLSALYPERALRLGIEGRAAMFCRVTAEGALEQCAIASEEPVEVGFGSAAVQLASKFTVERLDKDGAPVAGRRVLVRLKFKLAHPPAKLPPALQAPSVGASGP